MLQEGYLLQGHSGRDCQSWDLNSGSQKGVSLRCSLHGEFSFLLYTVLGGQGYQIIKTDQCRCDIYSPPSLVFARCFLLTPIGFMPQDETVRNCELQIEHWGHLEVEMRMKVWQRGNKIMKSSHAVSLGRRILLEGEFKGFRKGKMVRWKAGFLSPEPGGKKRGRKSWCDVYLDGGRWAWEEERFLIADQQPGYWAHRRQQIVNICRYKA